MIFNQFCEEFIAHNFGNGFFTLLGRDIVVFFTGYIARIIVECIIVLIQERRK